MALIWGARRLRHNSLALIIMETLRFQLWAQMRSRLSRAILRPLIKMRCETRVCTVWHALLGRRRTRARARETEPAAKPSPALKQMRFKTEREEPFQHHHVFDTAHHVRQNPTTSKLWCNNTILNIHWRLARDNLKRRDSQRGTNLRNSDYSSLNQYEHVMCILTHMHVHIYYDIL